MTENISTIIMAVSAFATAGATIVLAVITLRYVRLTNEILKATNKPEVILFLRYRHRSISLCVQNIGTGYASDVEFGDDLTFKTIDLYGREENALKNMEPFKSGINYLGAGHKLDTFLCHEGDVRDLKKRSFKILVSYKDSADEVFSQTFSFDIGNWENTSQFITPYTDDVANAVERVASNIEHMRRRGTNTRKQGLANQFLLQPLIEALNRIAKTLERISQEK